MSTEKIKVLVMMLFAVLSVSVGEAMLARGMKQTNAVTGDWWAQVRGVVGNGNIVVGTLLMATFFLLYSLALKKADFSFVLPITALTYLLGALLAKYYLGETVTPGRWLGAAVITLGVLIVAFGGGEATHKP